MGYNRSITCVASIPLSISPPARTRHGSRARILRNGRCVRMDCGTGELSLVGRSPLAGGGRQAPSKPNAWNDLFPRSRRLMAIQMANQNWGRCRCSTFPQSRMSAWLCKWPPILEFLPDRRARRRAPPFGAASPPRRSSRSRLYARERREGVRT